MRRLLFGLIVVSLTVGLNATVIVPIEFREMVTSAPVIVHGRVTDVRSALVDGRRSVDTFVTVDASEYLKGNLGDHVTFRVPGGEVGRYRTVFVGAPEFRTGDEVVLFLKTARGTVPIIVGFNQGAFRVVADPASGRRMVTAPILMSRGGTEPEPVVRGAITRRPLAVDAFRDVVRGVLAEAAAR
jgi:hypothetical protein